MRKVLWGDYPAAELRDLAARDPIVVVPIGSTEQHGPHLPVQVDSLLVAEVARRAAERGGDETILVMPTIWTGLAEHHMGFGGTVTLDYSVFHALIRQVCVSLTRQGIRRIALLNGHGGNIVALQLATGELAREIPGVVATATYFLLAEQRFAGILERQDGVRHACEAETSMTLALRPDLVDIEAMRTVDAPAEGMLSPGFHRWRPIEHWSDSGVIGYPPAASAEKGERLLEAAADAVRDALVDEELWTPPAAQVTV
ncbi:MAG: creatininase family protein [Bauldia sp.]|uniref:creatininase family protein n=1 Tax=Bauldia sp. TaxID=2575872 RepID=UPI001E10E7DC|nr:creatininase family protein [Bauldia sp.]MCB1497257.1 creatininase family protein [Bauldia sp.]